MNTLEKISKYLDSFSKSGKYLESFYDLTASMDKIGHLFDIPIDEIGNEKIDPNLSNFSLKTGDLKISSSIGQTIQFPDEFRIQEGEKIGLVCSFTEAEEITDVFFGLQEPINGFPIYYNKKLNKSLSKSGLRSKIRLIRNPDLISGTLRDNFLLYNLGIGSEEIEEALEKIGLLEKINKLESGISTQISTNGYPFKKEERFLLLIASSITSTSDFLILHHTLDQIHSKSRSGLMKYLNEEGSRSQAYFITSSSPENLSFCDRIYQLNSDGKILELSPKAE